MNQERLAGRQVIGRELAGQLDPGGALAFQLLQDEAVAAPHAAAERLLQPHAGDDARRSAQPAVPVHEVGLAGVNVHRHDVAGHLGREGDLARAGAVSYTHLTLPTKA